MYIEGNASKLVYITVQNIYQLLGSYLTILKSICNKKLRSHKSQLLLLIVFIRKWIFNTNIIVVVGLLQNEVGLEVDTLVVSKLSLDNSY